MNTAPNPFDRFPQAPIPPELFDNEKFADLRATLDNFLPDLVPDKPFVRINEADYNEACDLLDQSKALLKAGIDQGELVPVLQTVNKAISR